MQLLLKKRTRPRALNPHLIMLGEGWRTYAGDENMPTKAADQDWMKHTDTVAVFSDDIRNNLKSGYPNEGQPAFITGGKRDINTILKISLLSQPTLKLIVLEMLSSIS